MPVTALEATVALRGVLGRNPNSDAELQLHMGAFSQEALLRGLVTSTEFRNANPGHRLSHFTSVFDAQELVISYVAHGLHPDPRYLTNAFGVKIDPVFMPHILGNQRGKIEPPPIPANWHADISEFAAVFRAVELSRDSFVVAELGCGWGCWLNISGVVARARGRDVSLIGVEADPTHIGFARNCCWANGFSEKQFTLHRGIAAGTSGVALFPKKDAGQDHWGLEPVFGASGADHARLMATGHYEELPVIPLATMLGEHPRLDLLHIDIQGGELALIRDSIAFLSQTTAYIVIGTHSRTNEGQLMEILSAAGWRLEIERPCYFRQRPGTEAIDELEIDGVQGWRNPAMTGG